MAYLRCTQCGSKALVAASRCPKCAHPFNLLDARGERAKLKRCRQCGIMHRVDAHCHWCGEVKSAFTLPKVDAAVWRSAAALALMLSAAGGVWRYAPTLRDRADSAPSGIGTGFETASETGGERGAGPAVAVQGVAAGALVDTATTALAAATSVIARTPLPVPATADTAGTNAATTGMTTPAQTPDGEIRWVPAVARTWVNVRSDASRGGEVVGVIKPASRAMLGTDRAGWRQVRSPDVSGWVDPRLFEPDSLRTRGE